MVPAGQGISNEEAQRIMKRYLECIMQFREQLAILQRKNPELQIHTYVDTIAPNAPGSNEAIVAELNNRYEIYIRLRDEVARVEGVLAAREQARAVAVTLASSRAAKTISDNNLMAEQLRSIVDRAVATLESMDPSLAQEKRSEIEAAARSCVEAKDLASAELSLTDLRVRVRRANQEASVRQERLAIQRDQDARAARDFLLRLEALGREFETLLRDNLIQVSSGQIPLTSELRSAAETATATAERKFAGNALKEALEQLGYEVQDGFETLFMQGGSSFFQRASWGEHHVRLTLDPQRQRLNLDMVRYGTAREQATNQELRDKEMEEQWCEEVPDLVSDLASRGLAIDFTRKLAPGTVALQVITDERIRPANAEKPDRRKSEGQKSLGARVQ